MKKITGIAATNAADLIELESFFIDLLALGKRLDWTHLTAFTARTDTTDTLTEFAQLARQLPVNRDAGPA